MTRHWTKQYDIIGFKASIDYRIRHTATKCICNIKILLIFIKFKYFTYKPIRMDALLELLQANAYIISHL